MRRIASLALVALAACGSGAPAPAPGSPAAPPPAAAGRRFLSLGTAPPGGAFFVVGGALAQVLSDRLEGVDVTAEATKGTQENLRRLVRGELDLALANSAITYFAVRGEEGWEEPLEVRAVMTLAPNVALFLARADGGVARVQDLAGRRVVLGPAGAGFEYFLRPILAAHGLRLEDLSGLNATQAAAVDLLGDGAADAAFLGGAVPTASISQAAASQDIRFIPYDEQARADLAARYPFFQQVTVPAGTYRGQDEPLPALDVGSMHLVVAASAAEDLVYRVTRAIYEGREAVIERHAAGKSIRPDNAARDLGTPFHPGAIRFFREAGIWPGAPAAEATP